MIVNLKSPSLRPPNSLWVGIVCVFWSFFCQAQTSVTAKAMPRATVAVGGLGAGCVVSDFMGIALTNHDPMERSAKVYKWIDANKHACDPRKLQIILNNRGNWLGTSNTPQMFVMLGTMLEAKLKGSPELMEQALGFGSAAIVAVPKADEALKGDGVKD